MERPDCDLPTPHSAKSTLFGNHSKLKHFNTKNYLNLALSLKRESFFLLSQTDTGFQSDLFLDLIKPIDGAIK
jgi:hypothetical protein